jgi:hypothetical protein
MDHTLLSVFDNRADAQQALDALLAAGFDRDKLLLSEGDPTAPGQETEDNDDGVLASIRHYFVGLFGTDRSEATRLYRDAVTRGHYVLTLSHNDQEEIERAADIIAAFGPVDIDEKDRQWRAGELLHGGGAHQGGASASLQRADPAETSAAEGVGAMRRATPGSTASQRNYVRIYHHADATDAQKDEGKQAATPRQRAIDHMVDPADVPAFQQDAGEAGDATALGGGVIVEGDILSAEDEAVFRAHWQGYYADEGGLFSEFEPAYRFGSTQRDSDNYRTRSWPESESALRSDWEKAHPDSPWERFKAAVRAGWDRIRS